MHAHRSAYIYHPYSASTDDLIFSNEVVIMPAQSPEPDAFRLSSASFASHDYFFDSTRSSPFLHDDNKFHLSRFIPHDTDFFCTKEMKDELYDNPFDTKEEYYQSTSDHYAGPEPESFLSDFDSDSDFEIDEDIRSAIPSVCATARKVKITPLRAVRRSIRRSSLPEPNNVRSAPSDAPSLILPEHGSTNAFAAFSLTHKLSIDNLKRMIPPWKTSDPVDPLATSPTSSPGFASSTRHLTTPSEQPGDITIIELHDVTLEAVRLAELMSSNFKFEPAEISPQQSNEVKVLRYGPGFFRRRSC